MEKQLSFKNIVCATGEIAKDYTDYLLTQHWRELRRIIYEERGHKCQQCKKEIIEYNLHHVTYKRIGYERKYDLKLLCYDCHEKVHLKKAIIISKKKRKKKQDIASILSEKPKERFNAGKYYNTSEAKKVYPVDIINTG